jgi:hypothetical protein
MAASRKSLEKIKELDAKRHHDSDAQRRWDRLVREYDLENATQTPPDSKGPELKALIEHLAEALDEHGHTGRHHFHDSDDCCGRGIDDKEATALDRLLERTDLETLAELVFERLIFEVRIERERAGRSA